jgi:hypothetical protein
VDRSDVSGDRSSGRGDRLPRRWRGGPSLAGRIHFGRQSEAWGFIDAGKTLVQCTGPDLIEISGSAYWSALEVARTDPSPNGIVQIGFANCRAANCAAGQGIYGAWGRSSSSPGCSGFSNRAPAIKLLAGWPGGALDYKVYHLNNKYRWFVGTQEYSFSPFESDICWTPRVASFFGETWDTGDQLGGTSSSHLASTLVNFTNTENGGFVWANWSASASCNYDTNSAPFRCDLTSSRSLDLWTDER